MNRGFLIIMIPALLVAAGYIAIFHYLGVTPGYGRLAGVLVLFFGAMCWLGRRNRKRSSSAN